MKDRFFILLSLALVISLAGNIWAGRRKPVRDYQIDLHFDTVKIYDGPRLVGSYLTNWRGQLDTILIQDNE